MYLYSEQGQGSIEWKIVRHGCVLIPFGLHLAEGWAAVAHLQPSGTSLVYRGLVPTSVVLLVSHVWDAVSHVEQVN